MPDNDTVQAKIDVSYAPVPTLSRDSTELCDYFLDDLPKLAQVSLVNDPKAIVHIVTHDLLTELLCEV